MRPPVSHPCPLEHSGCSRRLAAGVCVVWLVVCTSGCGLFGSGQQLKQLQMENDRLLSEYRSQRERLATLQETNAALEARVGEAERLLAQTGKSLPSSRISRAPQRSPSDASTGGTSANTSSGARAQNPPKYIAPSVPSLPGTESVGGASGGAASGEVQWRPMRRQ